MEAFLKSVEKRAFRLAQIATGNRDDALDILQEAMFKFAQAYADKPPDQWKPLFYRVLQNKIRDWRRYTKIRKFFTGVLPSSRMNPENSDNDPWQLVQDQNTPGPFTEMKKRQALTRLEAALRRLPAKQQQVFLLRAWEDLSVEETATAMACTSGTVKTHYSRAVNTLREKLEGVWP